MDNKNRFINSTLGKIIFSLIIIICLLAAFFLILFFSSEINEIKTDSSDTIDSLTKNCYEYSEQINDLKTKIHSLDKKIQTLKNEISIEDSIKNHCKQRSYKDMLLLKKSRVKIEKYEEQIREYEENRKNCLNEVERKNAIIKDQKYSIQILRSRHDISIAFLLKCSLKYYPSDKSKEMQISGELDRISRINGWQESCKHIVKEVSNSSESRYRSIYWLGLKTGCPYDAAYFLIKEYGYDPVNIRKVELIGLLKNIFTFFPRDFKYCSIHIKKIFNSESETFQRLKNSVVCLKKNLELE